MDVSANPGDWTAEQVRQVQLYGTCRTCGAPRTSVIWEQSPGEWWAELGCLNGHQEPDV